VFLGNGKIKERAMKVYTKDELPQHLPDNSANPNWLAMRATRFTGSDFYLFMSLLKKGELTETAESKLYEKVLANFGDYPENITSAAMERGTELEPEARAEYIAETFNDVQEVGFVDYESLRAGVSPDGVIYDADGNIDRLVEIKCPTIKNYIKMAKGKIPTQYIVQTQMQMLITGAKSCDFVIYHPSMRLVIKNIKPDEQMQKDIVAVLEKLNPLYDEILSDIETMRN
jgi:putative phage-type endonuclease